MKIKKKPRSGNKVPTVCPHCCKYVFNPPGYLRVLAVLSPGRGRPGAEALKVKFAGIEEIGRRLGVSRQRAHMLVRAAAAAKVVEMAFGAKSRVYTKSQYGHQLLSAWIRCGWTPGNPRVNGTSLRNLGRKQLDKLAALGGMAAGLPAGAR